MALDPDVVQVLEYDFTVDHMDLSDFKQEKIETPASNMHKS